MLRAIIIDDEEPVVETLRLLALRNTDLIKIVAGSTDPLMAINLIEDYKPDVVFLDISMPVMSGFELLARLSFRSFKLIFVTAHRDYAIEAIKNKAFDYLLKPVNGDDFRACLERVITEADQNETVKAIFPTTIDVQVKDGILYIRQKEIIRLEASRSYTEIYMDNGTRLVASKTLREFELKLDPAFFYRCHKSHVINIQKVQKFINHDGFFALMNDGSMANISKSNKDEFLEVLKRG